LSEENISNLKKTEISSISVSVDSDIPKIHDFIRGKECFQSVISGIKKLRHAIPNLKISINFTICKLNYGRITKMVEFASNLGINQVNFAPLHNNLQQKNLSDGQFQELHLDKNDVRLFKNEISSMKRLAFQKKIRISSNYFINGISPFFKEKSSSLNCHAGYISCAINPKGFVSPCIGMESVLNVQENSLEEIWRSFLFQNMRNRVKSCHEHCWDTTNAELAIKCTFRGVGGELKNILKDIRTYKRRDS
jgi:MoaA/NifB/PqqE/SkfB family radical SAM enzyme